MPSSTIFKDIVILGQLFSGILIASIGIFVYFRNRVSKTYISFSLFCLAASIFLFASFAMFLSKNEAQAIMFDRIVYTAVAFLITFMYQFSLYFTKAKRPKSLLLYCAYASSIFFLIVIQTDYFVSGLFKYQWGVHTKAMPLHNLFVIFLVTYSFLSLIKFYSFFRQSTGVIRIQAGYVLTAFIILTIIGPLELLPAYGIGIYPFAYFSEIIFALIVAYAMVKHRLMDIKFAIIKSASYVVMLLSIASFFIFFVYYLKIYYQRFINPDIVFIGASFTTAFGFQPLKKFVNNVTDNFFLRPSYNFDELLGKISQALNGNIEANDLVNELLDLLQSTIKISNLFLRLKDKSITVSRSSKAKSKDTSFMFELVKYKKSVTYDEVKKEKELSKLRKLNIDLVIKIPDGEECLGILALGPKLSGETYTLRDLKLLEIVAPQIAIALENAKLYEQATTDSLTGLYHNKYFQLRLTEEFARVSRHHLPISLIMLDIDRFKQINDKYGHQVGDKVLVEFSNLIKKSMRSCDIIGRYGGDEFVMLLPVINKNSVKEHNDDTKKIIKRLRKVIFKHSFTDMGLKLQVSLGVAIYDGKTAIKPCDLIKKADELLYKAKNSGRDAICVEKIKLEKAA